ncbi:hypothetical protein [Pseudomonas sp. UBA4194]|uniref:hypothetical protein n=1 Tax=Pseudomonas sp. UBA4194 TaxID=1947317 RepID=UPI0025D1D71C|nr:hypothetical protein [Pseudomonas sp. UBA4194]
MSLALIIFMLVTAWLAVAAAMLWGVLRIARRHQHHPPRLEAEKPIERPTTVH